MTVQEINNLLSKNYDSLALWANTKGNNQWEYVPKGKWTAGQHVLHLTQSTKPLIKGLSTPKILLKYRFGKCNRPIRTYEEVVSKYHTKLERLVMSLAHSHNRCQPSLKVKKIPYSMSLGTLTVRWPKNL